MTSLEFPNRIWERTDNGWASRPPTPEEIDQRRKLDRQWQEWRAERKREAS